MDYRYTHCGISIDIEYTIDGGEVLIEHASIDGKDAMDFIECSYVKGGVLLADRIIEGIRENSHCQSIARRELDADRAWHMGRVI
jgi:hypothetical protein